MSGTGTDISLDACYAMSGMDIPHVATSQRMYPMSGTDTAYGVLAPYALAARCPVLTYHMKLRVVRFPTRLLRDVRY
eukprot:3912358-Rhodomonas_salina.2